MTHTFAFPDLNISCKTVHAIQMLLEHLPKRDVSHLSSAKLNSLSKKVRAAHLTFNVPLSNVKKNQACVLAIRSLILLSPLLFSRLASVPALAALSITKHGMERLVLQLEEASKLL